MASSPTQQRATRAESSGGTRGQAITDSLNDLREHSSAHIPTRDSTSGNSEHARLQASTLTAEPTQIDNAHRRFQ